MEMPDRGELELIGRRDFLGMTGRASAVLALAGMSALLAACKDEAGPGKGTRWVCMECGWEYDGRAGPFEKLSEDWVCPLCGASKSLFRREGGAEESEEQSGSGMAWVCGECGWEYGGQSGPFEDLPDGWVCPVCGASKAEFKRQAPRQKSGWICGDCGWEYGNESGPFEQLPDRWYCPVCGAPKSRFKRKN
jgi:rubredoxin